MFGAKYSRLTFWIWSVLLLIPFSLFSQLMRATESDPELANSSLIFSVLLFIVVIMWINALANRIRDYGSNPWIAAFSLLPLANIGLALYYGIVLYKNKPVENNTNENNSNPSLSKAVYNHSKDIANDIKPTINEYKEKHQTSKTNTSNISSIDEDAIYEKVMIEIEEDNKVKSTWAKALAQSDGDKDKAEAIYIKVRASKISKQTVVDLENKHKNSIQNELRKKSLKQQRLNNKNDDEYKKLLKEEEEKVFGHSDIQVKNILEDEEEYDMKYVFYGIFIIVGFAIAISFIRSL